MFLVQQIKVYIYMHWQTFSYVQTLCSFDTWIVSRNGVRAGVSELEYHHGLMEYIILSLSLFLAYPSLNDRLTHSLNQPLGIWYCFSVATNQNVP